MSSGNVLYLTFDVDSFECLAFGGFEHLASFTGHESKLIIFLQQEFLAVIIADELGSVAIGFESKLLGDKS